MAIFPAFKLTKKGEELLNRCVGEGKTLTFTKIKIGDGTPSSDWRELIDVENSFKEFPILETSVQKDQTLKIKAYFDNKDFLEDKKFREVGVFVSLDTLDGEFLYSYTNAGDTADTLPAKSKGFFSRTLDILNYIGYACNVTFNIENVRNDYDFNTESEIKVATFLKSGDRIRQWGRLVQGDIQVRNGLVTSETTSFPVDNGLFVKLTGEITVSTIDELKNLNGAVVGTIINVLGYHKKDDGANHKRIIANEDDGSGVKLSNVLYANIVHNGEVNVSWFGAKGDGVTDETAILNTALKIGKIVNFEQKTYIINGSFIPSWETAFQSYGGLFAQNNQTINFNGSIIQLNSSSGRQPSGLHVMGKKNVTLNNPNLLGFKKGTTEFGHGILLWTNNPDGTNKASMSEWSENITIINPVVNGFNGDSIYISGAKNVVIDNPMAIANRRNGITINSGINITIKNYIATDVSGTDPQSAIDIETDFPNGIIKNIYIDNIKINNCNNAVFVLADKHKVENIKIKNVRAEGKIFKSSPFRIFLDYRYTKGSSVEIDGLDYSQVIYRADADNSNFKTSIISATDIDGFFNKLQIKNITTCQSLDTYTIFSNSYKDMKGGSLSFGVILNGIKNDSNFYIIEKSIGVIDSSTIIADTKNFFRPTSLQKEEWKGEYVNVKTKTEKIENFSSSNGGSYVNDTSEDKTLYFYARKIKTKIYNPRKNKISLYSNSALEKFRHNFLEYVHIDTDSDVELIYNPEDNVYDVFCNLIHQNMVLSLNTPYHVEKMKHENVYTDFISYMDSKTEYDNRKREEEKNLQEAYKVWLESNPDGTYEEFVNLIPSYNNLMLLPEGMETSNEEPQPSEALLKFKEKYLG